MFCTQISAGTAGFWFSWGGFSHFNFFLGRVLQGLNWGLTLDGPLDRGGVDGFYGHLVV